MSYRELANNAVALQACKRDQYVEAHGVEVTARLPETQPDDENDDDYFNDHVEPSRVDDVRYVVPKYENYYQILTILGENVENELPLECLAKVSDHWPENTLFDLPVKNHEGDLVSRTWRVTTQEVKHLESMYGKSIYVVPARLDRGDV